MAKKLFRYRKPSVSTMLGISQAKRRTGIGKLKRNPIKNYERRVKRAAGYYSEPMRAIRHGRRKPCGLLVLTAFIIVAALIILIAGIA